jgi:peptidoglycan/LPS O-acetylase OafA/YrhL
MVAVYHLGWWWWRSDPIRQMPKLAPFVAWGWVGVPIFFVISGFVIALSAEGSTPAGFAAHRAARLYPASWICASLIFAIQPMPVGSYLRTMILSPVGPWVSGVYWTLAIEIAFYALVTVCLWLKWDLAKVALCLGLYSAGFWFLRGVNSFVGRPVDFNLIENYSGYLLLAHDGVFFALGMLFQQRRYDIASVVFVVSGFVAVATRSHALAPGTPGSFMTAPLVWLVAIGLIAGSVFNNEFIRRWTRWLPTRTIGLMTYPLYLIHMDIGRQIMLRTGVGEPASFFIGLVTVFLLALAILPFESLIRRAVFNPRRMQRVATQN